LFGIIPEYDLNIMKKGQDLFDITSEVLLGMKLVLEKSNPDLVFVHGDTTTSISAALACYYKQIPVAHVEAGLRTHNIYSPWPEEINRQLTSRIASYHFAPTKLSKENLINEGILEDKIEVTGNSVIDSLHSIQEMMAASEILENEVIQQLELANLTMNNIEAWNVGKKLVLITGHRRENFGKGFLNICEAIDELAEKYKDVDFVYPMHLNPNVRSAIYKVFGDRVISNLHFIEPLDYLPFVYLMSRCFAILTDSGGIQEEAPGLGKPVFVMRDTTERPEALDAGTVKLVGTDKNRIVLGLSSIIDHSEAYNEMSNADNPYGDGRTTERIINYVSRL
jgi:UDP-N-acetylglucosamine 2-epimerase (non-hydrolysing)